MLTHNYNTKSRLLPFLTIQEAIRGNVDAITSVLRCYQNYIVSLTTSFVEDSTGRLQMVNDEQLKRRLETKLIVGILSFKVK